MQDPGQRNQCPPIAQGAKGNAGGEPKASVKDATRELAAPGGVRTTQGGARCSRQEGAGEDHGPHR